MNNRLYKAKKVTEIYFIGAVMLFTLSVGGTLLISLFKNSVDLLAPLKALTLYGAFSFLLIGYTTDHFLEGLERKLALATELAVALSVMSSFVPHMITFFGETSYYSLGHYPITFKLFPAIGILFAITGVFVVVYYSVDIDAP